MVFNRAKLFISYKSVGLILFIFGILIPIFVDDNSLAVEPEVKQEQIIDIQSNGQGNLTNFQLLPPNFPLRLSGEYLAPADDPDIRNLPFGDLQQEFPSFDPLQDQERESLDDVVVPDEVPLTDPNYINPPTRADRQKVNPFTTRLSLNDLTITHLTDWEVSGSLIGGEGTSSSPNFNALFTLNSEIFESLRRDRVFTVDQRGEYLHLRTVLNFRSVTTTQLTPVTIIGEQLQMSLTGECIATEAPPGSICTYTPGLKTDRSSIDPKTFLPTRIDVTSNFGDIVTPESLKAIAEPGFQQGARGQEIGLNLYFPNSGVVTGNSQRQNVELTRQETLRNSLAGSYLTVRQIVQANGERSAIARTVRGFPFIDDENILVPPVLSAINLLLPDLEPNLAASDPTIQAKSRANRNLFFAVNNTRLPPQSFVIYQAGKGQAPNTPAGATQVSDVPKAWFNSIWFGLSPVISRRSDVFEGGYEVIRPLQVVESGGGEGGQENQNIDFSSVVNNEAFSNNTLTSPYLQVYFTFYDQEANVTVRSIYSEDTNYYPHLSFTGNITDSTSAFRYYAGVIVAEDIKPYLGLDYTQNYPQWNYRVGGIGYLNSDRDYYSVINGNVNYLVPLDQAQGVNLTLSSGIQYALQNETKIGDTVSVVPLSEVSLGASLGDRLIQLGVRNFWGLDNLANNSRSKMLVNFGVNLTENFSLSGYVAPYDENPSRTQYGLNLNWNLGGDYNTPQLSLGWNNYEYRYGRDVLGNARSLTDNVFTLTFRLGRPNNPFRQPPPPSK